MEVPVVKEQLKESTKMETDDIPPQDSSETDVNMQDDKVTSDASENHAPESGDKPVQMETDAKVCYML